MAINTTRITHGPGDRKVAYFSMEIGLDAAIPTYSGGLGVLSGDTVRSAADLRVPMVAVTLLHRKGYFYQRLDLSGWQREEPALWVVEDFLTELPARTSVTIEGRTVRLRAWTRNVVAQDESFVVPVILLDADLPENTEWDRTLTHFLYGGDTHYRICQEVILGLGGLRMLRELGYANMVRYHMNEGHAAFLALELLDERLQKEGRAEATPEDVEFVRSRCVFTTHTPVPAGHDKFPPDMVARVFGDKRALANTSLFETDGQLNMTYLALNLSCFVNGVAKRHGEVAARMFPRFTFDSITNGVHAPTWTSQPFQELFDKYLCDWRTDAYTLRSADSLPPAEVWAAHLESKERLIHFVNREDNAGMNSEIFTIGFARRAATYKRAGLLLHDVEWLKRIAADAGGLQIIYAGKAHPHDRHGKELIQHVFQVRESLQPAIRISYVENYDMEIGKLMTSGVDLWLNTPQAPLEASGTSGMKAALNGIPSLSVIDGWWVEGCVEGVTGWAIGEDGQADFGQADNVRDAASLYNKLEHVILPLFRHDRPGFIDVMRHCIAINGSYFNTHRMMHEYVLKAYFR
ncbi:MAG: alpha-glucan family phosphorylase [Phycisphaerales bacterium]|nr:alpha-glucan family phosphorylase [Phycisphaerales bacterium]